MKPPAKRPLQGIVKAQADARKHAPPRPRAPTKLTGERLLTPKEVGDALMDRVLMPPEVLPLSAVLKQLKEHVELAGGIVRFAQASGSSYPVISDALRGARGGIGRKAAAYLGLRPTILRVMAYKVISPRKFYRHRPSLI